MKIGILAVQGAVGLHADALDRCGIAAVEVRTTAGLADVDGLIMPGGESTTMSMLLERAGLFEALAARIGQGLPVFGTCAGMILLADGVEGGRDDQRSFGAIDIDVERNGYGRQRESFEAPIDLGDGLDPFPGVFIRAPRVLRAGPSVEVQATLDDTPVLARSGSVMASSFHPELSDDLRLHQRFLVLAEDHQR
jgi:5'-phosphate synthase pdxT subunit